MWFRRLVVASVGAGLLVASCSAKNRDDGPLDPARGTGSVVEPPGARPSEVGDVVLPDVGTALPHAFATVTRMRLRVAYTGPGAGCGRPGVVRQQHPSGGSTSPIGAVVQLVVRPDPRPCRLTEPRRRVAEEFIGFARGRAGLITRARVVMYVGHAPARELRGAALVDPGSWRGCPASGGYAGKVCPFSATTGVGAGRVAPLISAQPPSHPCLHASRLPPRALAAFDSVTVSLPGDCTAYEGVRIFFDADGRVVAVDYETSEP